MNDDREGKLRNLDQYPPINFWGFSEREGSSLGKKLRVRFRTEYSSIKLLGSEISCNPTVKTGSTFDSRYLLAYLHQARQIDLDQQQPNEAKKIDLALSLQELAGSEDRQRK